MVVLMTRESKWITARLVGAIFYLSARFAIFCCCLPAHNTIVVWPITSCCRVRRQNAPVTNSVKDSTTMPYWNMGLVTTKLKCSCTQRPSHAYTENILLNLICVRKTNPFQVRDAQHATCPPVCVRMTDRLSRCSMAKPYLSGPTSGVSYSLFKSWCFVKGDAGFVFVLMLLLTVYPACECHVNAQWWTNASVDVHSLSQTDKRDL